MFLKLKQGGSDSEVGKMMTNAGIKMTKIEGEGGTHSFQDEELYTFTQMINDSL
jgi:hypothetical protein